MNVNECYCLCLCIPLGLPVSNFNNGSYSAVCVRCNGISKFWLALTNTVCTMASTSFVVKYGDCVDIMNDVCKANLSCLGVIDSCTCVFNVTPMSGSFQVGTTCLELCSYTIN